ncbi:MAG: hypothetical protein ACFCVF_16805 [Kineosporiaceae bacterium]
MEQLRGDRVVAVPGSSRYEIQLADGRLTSAGREHVSLRTAYQHELALKANPNLLEVLHPPVVLADALEAALDAAETASPLPADPGVGPAAHDLLIRARLEQ